MHAQAQKKMYKVLIPIEKKGGGATYWMRVGTGFTSKDSSSLNLYIDAFPSGDNKMLHVRELDEEDLQRRDQRADRRTETTLLPSAAADDVPF